MSSHYILLLCLLAVTTGYAKVGYRNPSVSVTLDEMEKFRSSRTLSQDLTGKVNVWPKPVKAEIGGETIFFCAGDFSVSSNADSNRVIKEAVKRYKKIMFHDTKLTAACTSVGSYSLYIEVEDPTATDLKLGVDESYSLIVDDGEEEFSLYARTIWGALRGLETFSQLVTHDESKGGYKIEGTPLFIEDAPRFPWRGIMIDTSRHFLSLDTIRLAIDALAYNKFNTLHWHIVDAQSFPVEILSYPLLQEKGAYSPGFYYKQSELKEIVEYAYLRGVRVVPEFDMPGHTASWGKGYPVTTDCPSYADNVNNIPLNPSVPLAFKIIEAILSEMTAIFPDEYLHLGGDEVVSNCWAQDASVRKFMLDNGYPYNYNKLWAYFEERVEEIYIPLNRTMVCWQELALNNPEFKPTKNALTMVWIDKPSLILAVRAGYQGLLSAGWYLDQQTPAGGTHYLIEDTWMNFYLNEPFVESSWTEELKAKVLGGEASMWGEQVDDSNFIERVFPRAYAVAERLWSLKEYNDVNEALPRLMVHRCKLVGRGIRGGPISPDFCKAVYEHTPEVTTVKSEQAHRSFISSKSRKFV